MENKERKPLGYRVKWTWERIAADGTRISCKRTNPPELEIVKIFVSLDAYGREESARLYFEDGTTSISFPYSKWKPANPKAVVASKYEKWLYVMRQKGLINGTRIPIQ